MDKISVLALVKKVVRYRAFADQMNTERSMLQDLLLVLLKVALLG